MVTSSVTSNPIPTMKKPKIKNTVDTEQVLAWLGDDDTLEQAIEIIADIANGDYKPNLLRQEITDHNQE